MIVTIVHVKVKPDRVQDFIKETQISQAATLQELGCWRYTIMQDIDNENAFILSEAYQNQESIDFHKETPHFLAWKNNVQEMMADYRVSSRNKLIV